MIYLFVNDNQIKLLHLKKTLLGQYETNFFEKTHEAQLLDKGKINNSDLLASAIKEALSLTSTKGENEVFLILPQEAFYFLRTEVPGDIAPSAIGPFIRDKARAVLPIDIENCISDCFIQETDPQKSLSFYALDREVLQNYQQTLSLIDLKIIGILPDTLAYFKLFEKTLRKEKKENILYVSCDKKSLLGYFFNSYGLVDPLPWKTIIDSDTLSLEKVLKEKALEQQNNKKKLNRVIISGSGSENIRQDTFTKAIGVWTNPLKRIIPTFYNDYLKLLVINQKKQFPILQFDVCFGAFIFHQENKNFSLLKNGYKFVKKETKPLSFPKLSLPSKEVLIFVGSFVLSFLFFLLISNMKISLPVFNKPTVPIKNLSPTSSPLPTPTPSFKKEDLKIKVLNGSGTVGKANDVKDILKNKGYQEVLTGNADNFNYTQSELEVKKSKFEAINMIKTDLKDYVASFKQTELVATEAADVVLIIGKDFK